MADPEIEELNEKFGTGNAELEPDVVAELKSIMNMHSLSVQDLFFKWESYSLKMEMTDMKPSLTTIRALKQDIQDALVRSNRSHGSHIKQEKRPGATPRTAVKNGGDVFGMLDGLVPNTPGAAKLNRSAGPKRRDFESPSMSRVKGNVPGSSPDSRTPGKTEDLDSMNAAHAPAFSERPNAGELVEVLNSQLDAPEAPIAPYGESRVKLTAASDQKKLAYKTMAMKLSEASEILDERIEQFKSVVEEHHRLDDDAFGSAAAPGTTEIVAVGRIASDSPEGKLNTASLVLETSRRTGGGRRVPIDLKKLNGRFQFFPGQIVAFKGTNAKGDEFTVNQVLEIPPLPSAGSTPAALEAHKQRLRGGPDAMDADDEPAPLNVIFASGPYSADDNLDFEPLHALCEQAADSYADAIVLNGPFIDVDHPLIASGDFDVPEEANIDLDTATMTTVFKYMISPVLNRLAAANPNITILLVPSVRDVVERHVSWPQEPFPKKELGLPKSAKIIGNPMTLSINEMVLGLSSQDVLWDLRAEEVVGPRAAEPNLLSRVAKYLIEQRHFFPIFPPSDRAKLPKTGTAEGVPTGAMLDLSYLKLGEMVSVRPDVVVVPSALPPFVKVIESVVVINPGYLSKRRGAGTYARLTLYPPKLSEQEIAEGAVVSHKIFERARVEITRI
ncbi:DNA polymerase alpha/epsilon subunit B [Microdochium bolleyi]|uniref:DNA polymerase alpha subunit B n=1 Tax=Microdochium bolleyi TaxID=196109 RepID=A0A136J7T7_9PEZI|nr:DNA polymerase alpha/epsilon subunit B [Microdochium bolleyi]